MQLQEQLLFISFWFVCLVLVIFPFGYDDIVLLQVIAGTIKDEEEGRKNSQRIWEAVQKKSLVYFAKPLCLDIIHAECLSH